MDKYDLLRALREDEVFRKEFLEALSGSPIAKEHISTNTIPFERDEKKENEKIQRALSDIDLNTLRKLVLILPELSKEMEEIFGSNTYLIEPNRVKKDLEQQLQKGFDDLFSDFHSAGKYGKTYFTTINGAFLTESGYSYVDGKWEPFVSIHFSPIEYLEY